MNEASFPPSLPRFFFFLSPGRTNQKRVSGRAAAYFKAHTCYRQNSCSGARTRLLIELWWDFSRLLAATVATPLQIREWTESRVDSSFFFLPSPLLSSSTFLYSFASSSFLKEWKESVLIYTAVGFNTLFTSSVFFSLFPKQNKKCKEWMNQCFLVGNQGSSLLRWKNFTPLSCCWCCVASSIEI